MATSTHFIELLSMWILDYYFQIADLTLSILEHQIGVRSPRSDADAIN